MGDGASREVARRAGVDPGFVEQLVFIDPKKKVPAAWSTADRRYVMGTARRSRARVTRC